MSPSVGAKLLAQWLKQFIRSVDFKSEIQKQVTVPLLLAASWGKE